MTTRRQPASQAGREARSFRHAKADVRTNRRHRWSGFPPQAGVDWRIAGLIAPAAPAGLVEKELVQRLLCGPIDSEIPPGRPPRPAIQQTARSQLAKPVATQLSPRDAPIFCASLAVSILRYDSRHFCARAPQKNAQRNGTQKNGRGPSAISIAPGVGGAIPVYCEHRSWQAAKLAQESTAIGLSIRIAAGRLPPCSVGANTRCPPEVQSMSRSGSLDGSTPCFGPVIVHRNSLI
jgi:hypothetical protein